MSISTEKYHTTFLPKPELTRILGVLTYNALHQRYLELKINAIYVHYNLGGSSHGHLGLLMTNTEYAKLLPVLYLRSVHPGILLMPNNAILVASYELKQVYDGNL